MATGWLIRDDLIVTAGHCAYDWSYKLGRLAAAKAYIGYSGKDSIDDANVQFRAGKRVTTTAAWLKNGNSRDSDISIIQVDPPFEDVTPIVFDSTPATGNTTLGVVGYPGDLKDDESQEAGAQMYEAYMPTRWSLADDEWKMLEYQIDTYGGNSGSPVFRQSDMVAIGAHTYGGAINSATVIGDYGINLTPYIAAFDSEPTESISAGNGVESLSFQAISTSRANSNGSSRTRNGTESSGISSPPKAHATTKAEPTPKSKIGTTFNGTMKPASARGATKQNMAKKATGNGDYLDQAAFMKIFNTAVSLGAPVESYPSGATSAVAFGDLVSTLGPMAYIALQSVGALGPKPANASGSEDAMPDGLMQRAILAESALGAMCNLGPDILSKYHVMKTVKSVVSDLAPAVQAAWPLVGGPVGNSAIRILTDALGKANSSDDSEQTDQDDADDQSSEDGQDNQDGQDEAWLAADPGLKSLIEGVAAAHDSQENSTEGFFSWLHKSVKAIGQGAGGILSIAGATVSKISEDFTADAPTSSFPSLAGLQYRALVAEAALRAMSSIPSLELQQQGSFDDMAEAARLGGFMKTHWRKIFDFGTGVYKNTSHIRNGHDSDEDDADKRKHQSHHDTSHGAGHASHHKTDHDSDHKSSPKPDHKSDHKSTHKSDHKSSHKSSHESSLVAAPPGKTSRAPIVSRTSPAEAQFLLACRSGRLRAS